MIKNRIIEFEKVSNFRDIGGLKGPGDHTIKRGLLFRSDELSRLTRNDIKKIEELKIKLICDLRTPNERKGKEDKIPLNNGLRLLNVPIYPHREDFTKQKFIHYLGTKNNSREFEELIKEYYFRFAFEQTQQIRTVFELISDKNNLPALIHCSVGKDRTGFISSLIQSLAGVHRNYILEDYLLSNERIKERTQVMIRFIRVFSLFRISKEKLKPMLEVRAEYLEEVLNRIEKEFGSTEAYLINKCLLDKSTLENFKKIILEK